MKLLKRIFLILGLVIFIGTAAFAFLNWQEIRNIYSVAIANQSTPSLKNPNVRVLLSLVVALLSGLLLGIGIAWPRRRHLKEKDVDRMVEERLHGGDAA